MNLCRFLSVCRPDNDPIDCPRFLRINRMIKLIHLSLFITSSLIHFIIHINNIHVHLLKWHLVVRFIVRDAINFCMFEWNFVSQSNLEDTVYVYLTLWNRTGAITGSNLVDLGVLRRAKSHQHPKNTVINSKIRRYQNKIRFSIGANVIIKRNCVFNGWLSAKLVNGSYIFNVYQDFKTLKTEFYSFHRSNGP